MRYIDPAQWRRKPVSDFFGGLDFPFYSTAFRTDVTGLYARAKASGVSVYHAVAWASMRALNGVDAFLYKLRGDTIVRHDFLSPSLVEPAADGELFKIVHVDWLPGEPMEAFCTRVAELAEKQDFFIDMVDEARDDLAYLSCLPWLDFTMLTQEMSCRRDDSIPRLTWGKIVPGPDGARGMTCSIQVNHRLVDGRHIGRFAEALQSEFDAR